MFKASMWVKICTEKGRSGNKRREPKRYKENMTKQKKLMQLLKVPIKATEKSKVKISIT